MSVILFCYPTGDFSTNCYLLMNNDIKKCVVIDPADYFEEIWKTVGNNGCVLDGILLTHGHFDHITDAKRLSDYYNIRVYAYKDEAALLADPDKNLSAHMGYERLVLDDKNCEWLTDGQTIELAGITFKVVHTPGHTEGGVCYYVEDTNMLFSGDTLFKGSVGRTDFPTGNATKLTESIKTKLFVLPDETQVYPGHGDSTDIGSERIHNPFIR